MWEPSAIKKVMRGTMRYIEEHALTRHIEFSYYDLTALSLGGEYSFFSTPLIQS